MPKYGGECFKLIGLATREFTCILNRVGEDQLATSLHLEVGARKIDSTSRRCSLRKAGLGFQITPVLADGTRARNRGTRIGRDEWLSSFTIPRRSSYLPTKGNNSSAGLSNTRELGQKVDSHCYPLCRATRSSRGSSGTRSRLLASTRKRAAVVAGLRPA
jgi:hypothetical protein